MCTKEKLLALLEENRDASISGEDIANGLGISRTAVWKAVKELRKKGYKIEAVTNRGYRLSEENDIISEQGINFPAAKIHCYSSVESTNILAKQMAVAGAEHFTVVMADHQSGGKGRYGRSFFSPPGCGIYMSLILRRSLVSLSEPTLVTAFTAVAVCKAIEKLCNKTPKIKWVNDIFLDGKKICGISTEAVTSFESGEIEWLVVGIGINFLAVDLPPELTEIVGAIHKTKPPNTTRNQLAAQVLTNMKDLESPLCEANLISGYKSRMLMLGEKITVSAIASGETYEATALDINPSGQLIIQKSDGTKTALNSGEISVRQLSAKTTM